MESPSSSPSKISAISSSNNNNNNSNLPTTNQNNHSPSSKKLTNSTNNVLVANYSDLDNLNTRRLPLPLVPIDNWNNKDIYGITNCARPKIVKQFGTLLDAPGPGHYEPSENYLSTNQTSCLQPACFHIIHCNNGSKLDNVPGPGSYNPNSNSPFGVEKTDKPYWRRRDKQPLLKCGDQVGPCSYEPSKQFSSKRIVDPRPVIRPQYKQNSGRPVLDLRNLSMPIRSEDRWGGQATIATDVLGPGHYYGPDINDPRQKHISYTMGSRRLLLEQPEVLPPGPGSYDSDSALFGEYPLGTGAVAQQRRSAQNLKHNYMKTIPTAEAVHASDFGFEHSGKWVKGITAERHKNAQSYYTHNSAGIKHTIERNTGRHNDSTVSSLPQQFKGKNSAGRFLRY